MVFAHALKSKKGNEVAKAFEDIFDNINIANFQGPSVCLVDRGSEFFNSEVKNLFKERSIVLKAARGLQKSALAERAIKSIKKIIMTAVQSGEWPENNNFNSALKMTCKNINGRYNRDIKMTPLDAFSSGVSSKKLRQQVWHNSNFIIPSQYMEEERNLLKGKGIKERGITWKIGQLVLCPVKRQQRGQIRNKEFKQKFNLHPSRIKAIFHSRRPLLFKLEDVHTKKALHRLFYSAEIKKAFFPPNIDVSKIIDFRVTQSKKLEYKLESDKKWHGV